LTWTSSGPVVCFLFSSEGVLEEKAIYRDGLFARQTEKVEQTLEAWLAKIESEPGSQASQLDN
jgi:hypothetical protein